MRCRIWGALVCALVFAGGVWAADRAGDRDAQTVRAVIEKAYENWAALNSDAKDPYYTADVNAVWFDLAPMQYVGWNAYKEGVKKQTANIEGANFKIHDDMAVQRRGNVAWATLTFTAEFRLKGGKVERMEARGTEILEKRKGQWIIVHEHVSVPAPLGP